MRPKFQFQSQINIWDLDTYFFVEIMVDKWKTYMHKGLTVPKWVLINRPKIPQMPPNLSAQIVCLSPKVWDIDEKKASLGVRSPCHLPLHGLPFTKIWLRLLYSFEAKSSSDILINLILFTIRQWICWVHGNIFLSK